MRFGHGQGEGEDGAFDAAAIGGGDGAAHRFQKAAADR